MNCRPVFVWEAAPFTEFPEKEVPNPDKRCVKKKGLQLRGGKFFNTSASESRPRKAKKKERKSNGKGLLRRKGGGVPQGEKIRNFS